MFVIIFFLLFYKKIETSVLLKNTLFDTNHNDMEKCMFILFFLLFY